VEYGAHLREVRPLLRLKEFVRSEKMSKVKELYKDKLRSVEEGIKLVQNGDCLVVPTGVGEPPALLTALSEHRREYHDVKLFQILPLRKFGYIDPETVDNIRHVAYFLGGATRAGGQQGWIDYIPVSKTRINPVSGK